MAGDFINLFDSNLAESSTVAMRTGTRAFLLDVNYFKSSVPRILAASAKILDEHATVHTLVFRAKGIEQRKQSFGFS